MSVIASVQLKLGIIRRQWARNVASWLWGMIMHLDKKRRCKVAIQADNEEEQLWTIRQLGNYGYDKKIVHTFRILECAVGISGSVAKAAQVALEMVERCR